MPIQGEALARLAVPYSNTAVGTTTRKNKVFEGQAYDALRVTFQSAKQLTGPPIPDFEGAVHGPCNQLAIVKLQTTHTACMACQHTQRLTGL